MKSPRYWKDHYVLRTDANEIERHVRVRRFASSGRFFDLICFEENKGAPNILVSQGSGGHAYVFAELAYRMHLRGYNVFIMPKHGDGFSIEGLMQRHGDALRHIRESFSDRIGAFGEGLGGFVVFYLALSHGPVTSIACQNSPAILTERKFLRAVREGDGAYRPIGRRLSLYRALARLFPNLRLPLSSYLNWEELIDPEESARTLETRLVKEGYLKDPDFDKRYRLRSIMSQISTPPSSPLADLTTPTMFLVAVRGVFPAYTRDLYGRLPSIKKRMVEVDGGVYWMLSHPVDAAKLICNWFDETLAPRTPPRTAIKFLVGLGCRSSVQAGPG